MLNRITTHARAIKFISRVVIVLAMRTCSIYILEIAVFFFCELSLRAGDIRVGDRYSVKAICDSKSSLVQMHSRSLRHLVPRDIRVVFSYAKLIYFYL